MQEGIAEKRGTYEEMHYIIIGVIDLDYHDRLIILSRRDLEGEEADTLDNYADYLCEQGVEVSRTTFLQHDMVQSAYTREEQFCQEVCFTHNGSVYALALRGGTVENFDEFLTAVSLKQQDSK